MKSNRYERVQPVIKCIRCEGECYKELVEELEFYTCLRCGDMFDIIVLLNRMNPRFVSDNSREVWEEGEE